MENQMNQVNDNLPSPAQLIARMRELATLPDIYIRIKSILDNPVSTHKDMAEALSTDPALSARLLRVANSAFYGRPGRINTIPRAVGLLGTQQVHDLVLATAVIHAFDRISPDLLDPRLFWHSSLAAAAAAKLLAEHCSILDSERLFVAGLLSRIGNLILLEELPAQMHAILAEVGDLSNVALAAVQRDHLGFDYTVLSAALFRSWQLPRELVEPIRLHTQPATAEEFQLEAAILHVAVYLADAMLQSRPIESVVPALDDEAWEITGLSIETLEGIERLALDLTAELAPAMLNAAA
jgi:HD-like signal output (HDOD) protein